ncbi:MAG: hypothetical protein IPH62_19885 [Ignavibacteriae bacterium]|nr:hypothetical protein [Ignavibacteriota bacterium]
MKKTNGLFGNIMIISNLKVEVTFSQIDENINFRWTLFLGSGKVRL